MTRKKQREGEDSSARMPPGTASALATPAAAKAEDAFSKVLWLVRTVQTRMQNIDGNHGLSGSQLWSIWQISAQPGLRVSELAAAQHIHPSTASNLIDKLEARNLVRRERRDADQRVVRLYLAEPGIDLVKRIPGPMQGRLRHSLQHIPKPVLAGLIKGITAVMEHMAASEHPPG